MDNSIIYQRLLSWADQAEPGVIRLHSQDIAFYVQSALESAQLLLLACLGSSAGEFRVLAISHLGWPVSLMDLALDVLARPSSPTPLYVSGYDQGYEEIRSPGLRPDDGGRREPAANAFEAASRDRRAVPHGGLVPGGDGGGTQALQAARGARLKSVNADRTRISCAAG